MDFPFSRPNYHVLYLFTLLILSFSRLASAVSCLPNERSALLQLKQGFTFSDLPSWLPDTDCCRGWEGVSCNISTGLVTALDLNSRNIQSNLSVAIFNLTSLQYLNLANNDFWPNPIPAGFEKLTMLIHLDLSNSNFMGQIPIGIANLTNLITLDLSCWSFCDLRLHKPNLRTLLSNLSNLRELNLDFVDISENGTEWCGALSESVPLLQVLSISNCYLSGPIQPSLSRLNFLSVIDLSGNNFNSIGQIPTHLAKLTKLEYLNMSRNSLSGSIPQELFDLPNLQDLNLEDNKFSGEFRLEKPSSNWSSPLESLDLSGNQLNGSIPPTIYKFSNLGSLDLSSNQFSGPIPNSIFELCSLHLLYLQSNKFSGIVKLSMLQYLSNLTELNLSDNQLSLQDISHEQLQLSFPNITYLGLASCNLSQIPRILRNIDYVEGLDLSNNQLHGVIPTWLWEKLISFPTDGGITLNLWRNMITSVENVPPCPNHLSFCPYIEVIDLSYNKIKGALPLVTGYYLDYSNNEFLEILSNYTLYLKDTFTLKLSKNRLTGEIPSSICETSLEWLDVPYNNLSGLIPSCILGTKIPVLLNLASNKFHGPIPQNISKSCRLIILALNNNNLNEDLPRSLTRCKDLVLFDIGNNRITGTFPIWLWEFPNIQIIILRSNRLYVLCIATQF